MKNKRTQTLLAALSATAGLARDCTRPDARRPVPAVDTGASRAIRHARGGRRTVRARPLAPRHQRHRRHTALRRHTAHAWANTKQHPRAHTIGTSRRVARARAYLHKTHPCQLAGPSATGGRPPEHRGPSLQAPLPRGARRKRLTSGRAAQTRSTFGQIHTRATRGGAGELGRLLTLRS